MGRPRKYPPELLDRGARVVIESGRPIAHVARDLGVPPETLRRYVRQLEADEGLRPDLPTGEEREEIKRLRREVHAAPRQRDPQGRVGVLRPSSTQTDRSEPAPSTSIAAVSASSRSAGTLGVSGPLTTSAPAPSVPRERSRTSSCSSASASCTRRTTTPTATGAPGRRCDVRAFRSAATASSG